MTPKAGGGDGDRGGSSHAVAGWYLVNDGSVEYLGSDWADAAICLAKGHWTPVFLGFTLHPGAAPQPGRRPVSVFAEPTHPPILLTKPPGVGSVGDASGTAGGAKKQLTLAEATVRGCAANRARPSGPGASGTVTVGSDDDDLVEDGAKCLEICDVLQYTTPQEQQNAKLALTLTGGIVNEAVNLLMDPDRFKSKLATENTRRVTENMRRQQQQAEQQRQDREKRRRPVADAAEDAQQDREARAWNRANGGNAYQGAPHRPEGHGQAAADYARLSSGQQRQRVPTLSEKITGFNGQHDQLVGQGGGPVSRANRMNHPPIANKFALKPGAGPAEDRLQRLGQSATTDSSWQVRGAGHGQLASTALPGEDVNVGAPPRRPATVAKARNARGSGVANLSGGTGQGAKATTFRGVAVVILITPDTIRKELEEKLLFMGVTAVTKSAKGISNVTDYLIVTDAHTIGVYSTGKSPAIYKQICVAGWRERHGDRVVTPDFINEAFALSRNLSLSMTQFLHDHPRANFSPVAQPRACAKTAGELRDAEERGDVIFAEH